MLLSYFITDPKYPFEKILNAIKTHKPTFVCYRNKEYFNKDEIIEFAKFASKYSKTFINLDSLQDESLIKYFDGVHIPSSKLNLIPTFKKITIASTHNLNEVKKAKDADFITFSPIFNSKNRKGVGIETLDEVTKLHPRVIALGGIISDKEVKEIKKSKAIGFGSIRYFLKEGK